MAKSLVQEGLLDGIKLPNSCNQHVIIHYKDDTDFIALCIQSNLVTLTSLLEQFRLALELQMN